MLSNGPALWPAGWMLLSLLAVPLISGQGRAEQPHPPGSSLLVLNSGRVVKGTINPRAGGFTVEKANGTMFVPSGKVRFRAANLQAAYRKLRKTMPEPTPANHFVLARWCFSHQLKDQCRRELRAILQQEPNHTGARTMLQRLDSKSETRDSKHEIRDSKQTRPEAFAVPETRSLAGLSPETARQFATEVQPILLNTCGNASCHGPRAESTFRLERSGRGHRIYAERNLANVLQFVDFENPKQSPLLTEPRGNHGRGGQTIFSSPGEQALYTKLKNWVAQIAQERSSHSHARPQSPARLSEQAASAADQRTAALGGRTNQASPFVDQAGRSAFPGPPPLPPRPGNAQAPRVKKRPTDVLDRIRQQQKPDPFSPARFNREVHPREVPGNKSGGP